MHHLFGSIPAILRELDPSGDAVEPVVFAAWRRCVDGVLAENVVPLRLENNRLIAAVSSETWRRNVANLGPALAAKVNAALGSRIVNYVEFQVDAATIRAHRRKSQKTEGPDAGQTEIAARIRTGLRPAAESITDEQLREQFLAAAASSLTRQEISQVISQSGITDS